MTKKATLDQTAEIVAMFARGDYDREFAQAIIGKRVIIKPEDSPYRGDQPSGDASAFRALIEYVQPSYAALKAAFDWVYDGYQNAKLEPIDICKDVSTEKREIEFELVHLNKDMSTDMVLAELDKRGLRPALYEELLGFAKQYPDEQRKYPIVALGSVYRDGVLLSSPFVYEHRRGRGLDFDWVEGARDVRYRFLAVRK